jgi:hypothetical protein
MSYNPTFPGGSPRIQRDVPAVIDGAIVPTTTVAGVTSFAAGNGVLRQTVWEFNAVAIATTDATTNGAFGSVQLTASIPACVLRVLGADVHFTSIVGAGGITTSAVIQTAFGTVAATTGALTNTNANSIAAATTIATLSSFAGSGRTTPVTTPVVVNASAGTTNVFFNIGTNDAGNTDGQAGTLTVTGRIVLTYAVCLT